MFFMPLCGCTDVIVQHLCLVLRVLEPVVGNDVVMPFGIHRWFESTGYSYISLFSLSSGIVNKILSHMCGDCTFQCFCSGWDC